MSSVNITYKQVYSRFLSKVEAYDLINMVEENAYELMEEWLQSVRANPLVRKLFSSISLSNTDKAITCSLKNSDGDIEYDAAFVIDLFGTGVAEKWVEPKYFSVLNTAQIFSGKEIKFYSQANHLDALEKMYKNCQRSLSKIITTYGFGYNPYLNGGEVNGV